MLLIFVLLTSTQSYNFFVHPTLELRTPCMFAFASGLSFGYIQVNPGHGSVTRYQSSFVDASRPSRRLHSDMVYPSDYALCENNSTPGSDALYQESHKLSGLDGTPACVCIVCVKYGC